MPHVTAHLSISLDGYVAGPGQSQESPLGLRGMELHHWHLDEPQHEVDAAMTQRLLAPRGAYMSSTPSRCTHRRTRRTSSTRCGRLGSP